MCFVLNVERLLHISVIIVKIFTIPMPKIFNFAIVVSVNIPKTIACSCNWAFLEPNFTNSFPTSEIDLGYFKVGSFNIPIFLDPLSLNIFLSQTSAFCLEHLKVHIKVRQCKYCRAESFGSSPNKFLELLFAVT